MWWTLSGILDSVQCWAHELCADIDCTMYYYCTRCIIYVQCIIIIIVITVSTQQSAVYKMCICNNLNIEIVWKIYNYDDKKYFCLPSLLFFNCASIPPDTENVITITDINLNHHSPVIWLITIPLFIILFEVNVPPIINFFYAFLYLVLCDIFW